MSNSLSPPVLPNFTQPPTVTATASRLPSQGRGQHPDPAGGARKEDRFSSREDVQSAGPHAPPETPTYAPRNTEHAGAQSRHREVEGGQARETEAQTQGTPGRRSTHTRRRRRKSSHEATRAAKQSVVNHAARASARGRGIGVRNRLLGYCRRQGSGHLPPAGVGLDLRQLLCLDGPCPLLKDAASSMPPEGVSSPFTQPP